jgi:hypothetical protein
MAQDLWPHTPNCMHCIVARNSPESLSKKKHSPESQNVTSVASVGEAHRAHIGHGPLGWKLESAGRPLIHD